MKKIILPAVAALAMASTANAAYIINSTSVTIGGVTYASTGSSDSTLAGVDLGTFSNSDSLIFDGTAATPIYAATASSGGDTPTGATVNDNYIHAGNNDGATLRIIVNGSTVSTTVLSLSLDPGSDKGAFGWGDSALADFDLIAAVGGAAGVHTVSYEIDYTFSQWDGANTQIGPQIHAPLASTASFTVSAAAVPEPSSAALLGLGGIALILRRRK